MPDQLRLVGVVLLGLLLLRLYCWDRMLVSTLASVLARSHLMHTTLIATVVYSHLMDPTLYATVCRSHLMDSA